MNRTERLYKIDQLIRDRRLVSFRDLLAALEVSRATLKRDLDYLRSRLNAPIVWDREGGGYRFEQGDRHIGGQYELPGLWFNATEVHALLTMQHLLLNLDAGGLLTAHVQPLMARLNALLGSTENSAEEIRKRVLIFGLGKRELQLAHFQRVGSALLGRKRLRVKYFARGTGESSEREISPQRLVHYRENWYLDAWCHLRDGLRSLSVDSIEHSEVLETRAKDISQTALDAVLGPGYGIFSGRRLQWAKLRFTALRARWVAKEQWHPKQKCQVLADGSYLLEFPYADDRELLMDILKYGAEVKVLAPDTLKSRVAEEIMRMQTNC